MLELKAGIILKESVTWIFKNQPYTHTNTLQGEMKNWCKNERPKNAKIKTLNLNLPLMQKIDIITISIGHHSVQSKLVIGSSTRTRGIGLQKMVMSVCLAVKQERVPVSLRRLLAKKHQRQETVRDWFSVRTQRNPGQTEDCGMY